MHSQKSSPSLLHVQDARRRPCGQELLLRTFGGIHAYDPFDVSTMWKPQHTHARRALST